MAIEDTKRRIHNRLFEEGKGGYKEEYLSDENRRKLNGSSSNGSSSSSSSSRPNYSDLGDTDLLEELKKLKQNSAGSMTSADRAINRQRASEIRDQLGKSSDWAKNVTDSRFEQEYVRPARYRDQFTNQIDNEIDRYQSQANAQLNRFENQAESAIDRNNDYLEQQIQSLQEQQRVGDQRTINLQNRRGGFYSGGTDYGLAQNQRATQQATGQVQSEVASRNAELNQQVVNYEQEIADQVNQLRAQAPDRVRQLVDQALQQQQQIEMQEAQLTGQYQGAPTLQAQQMEWNQDFQQQQFDTQQEQYQQQFAYQQARDQIQDERWQIQFDEDVRRWGLDYALNKQTRLGNLAQGWASQNLAQQRFDFQQQQYQNEQQQQQQQQSQDELASRNDVFRQNQQADQQQLDTSSYNSFLMDIPELGVEGENGQSISPREEGLQLIEAYRQQGVSEAVITQMIEALNSNLSDNQYYYGN